ncbi:unnamed protein product [Pleuronectes platessa]|uniref:Uncharacterized protein n=1 Tax=Pleuronectes platessa TaxID=8262 RepID=A0A9N7UWF5_PLEPL|nr:unnamed protein product [Pleuronectes platessa]
MLPFLWPKIARGPRPVMDVVDWATCTATVLAEVGPSRKWPVHWRAGKSQGSRKGTRACREWLKHTSPATFKVKKGAWKGSQAFGEGKPIRSHSRKSKGEGNRAEGQDQEKVVGGGMVCCVGQQRRAAEEGGHQKVLNMKEMKRQVQTGIRDKQGRVVSEAGEMRNILSDRASLRLYFAYQARGLMVSSNLAPRVEQQPGGCRANPEASGDHRALYREVSQVVVAPPVVGDPDKDLVG